MAELIAGAFLSSFFQFAFERLASKDFKDLFHKGLLKKLEITLNSINQLLDDAETKQYQNQNVKNWLDDLKHEIYEVDQLLDEMASNGQQKSKGKRFISILTNPFESRIKDLLGKLNFLAEQKDMLGLTERKCARNELEVGPKSSIRIPMTSLVDESNICGRKGDKEKIVNYLLLDNGSSNHAPIISIVGLGGMGKTTLAQLVYNDHMIQKSFNLKAWVYVSESFDVVGLTKAILESCDCLPTSENLETLQRQLQERLTGYKYLLVLDDVWNGNVEIWDYLLLSFNKGSSGSKIIVTTRNREVATSMKSSMLLDLERLEGSDSWSLFVKLAFHNRNVSEYPTLESIGKDIVEKCGGLPLAVKTLRNLLQRKFSQSEWVKILKTDLWCLSERDSNINPVLRLSYQNLPSNLKRCFSYCSIFPKGYEFMKNQLINLWMAEGLLKCCRRDQSEGELGNELFDDLVSISFFQQSPHFEYDETFVMHDLVNDLAKSESLKFCLQIDEGEKVQDICERTRHIWCSLDLKDDAIITKQICKIKGLRSLLVRQRNRIMRSNDLQLDIFSKLKYLRMLSFRGCELTELSNKISNLKLLRYLDLTGTKIKSLPDSICDLYNLETLILEECYELTELPLDFHKLVCLRHLYLKGTNIKKMPKKIGRLNHLQMLSHFVVGEKCGSDIKELNNLNHLRGKLRISGLCHVINPTDAAEANIKDKNNLEELSLSYYNGGALDVLEVFQPNSNLKRLTVEYYNGKYFPNWLRGYHLPNLVSLVLMNCGLCSQLPRLGQLPCLKELFISHCDGIKTIGEEFYDNNNSTSLLPFRSLEFLEFEQMDNWEEWLCFEGFPLLKKLCIRECPKLKRVLPQHLPSLQELKISSCHELEECLCLEGSPLLKNVSINNCSKLKVTIPKGDSMIELNLQKCDRILVNGLFIGLKKFSLCENGHTEFSEEQNLVNCSDLEELVIHLRDFVVKCPSLDLRCYNSLRRLSITGWHSSSLPFSLHLFTNLHYLYLYDCPQLESFSMGGLPFNLNYLTIENCPKLIASREVWGMPSNLSSLTIRNCPKLIGSREEWGLFQLCSNLHTLEIYNCPKLIGSREEWGLFQLNSLKWFTVSGYEFENVESFPEENLLPPTLETLYMVTCSKLRRMNNKGFLHLNSLESLSIENCPSLESLPEEGLQQLSSLSQLEIDDCPIIREKYKKEGGERWHTISHIPHVYIDGFYQI